MIPTDPHIVSSGEPSTRIVVRLPADLPRTLVSDYLDDCRKDLSSLNTALMASDHERARVIGHQMKGTGQPYGFPDLSILGSAIEQAATRPDTAELRSLYHQLADYLTRVELAGE